MVKLLIVTLLIVTVFIVTALIVTVFIVTALIVKVFIVTSLIVTMLIVTALIGTKSVVHYHTIRNLGTILSIILVSATNDKKMKIVDSFQYLTELWI